jgi:hypothetical protein
MTGWLILLIILLVLSIGSASSSAVQMERAFKSLLPTYPSLATALLAVKLFNGAAVCAAFYTAWVLYRRRPGTLPRAQAGLLVRCCFIIGGGASFPVLAGLPPDITADLREQVTYSSIASLVFTAAWHLYLSRSQKLRDLYS